MRLLHLMLHGSNCCQLATRQYSFADLHTICLLGHMVHLATTVPPLLIVCACLVQKVTVEAGFRIGDDGGGFGGGRRGRGGGRGGGRNFGDEGQLALPE